jgi:hypothetical protein
MQKEDIFALLDQLYIDQSKFNKFMDYLSTFTKEPRCKKGCLEFIVEIYNLPNIVGKDELAIQLLSEKNSTNAFKTRRFIEEHQITTGYNEALKNARYLIMGKIGEYIIQINSELEKSDLQDKYERQVYLRRAVARLKTIFYSNQKTTVLEEQWPEVAPWEYTDYLTNDLQTLVGEIACEEDMLKWSSVYGDFYHLDCDHTIASLRTYLNYLDTFLKF